MSCNMICMLCLYRLLLEVREVFWIWSCVCAFLDGRLEASLGYFGGISFRVRVSIRLARNLCVNFQIGFWGWTFACWCYSVVDFSF